MVQQQHCCLHLPLYCLDLLCDFHCSTRLANQNKCVYVCVCMCVCVCVFACACVRARASTCRGVLVHSLTSCAAGRVNEGASTMRCALIKVAFETRVDLGAICAQFVQRICDGTLHASYGQGEGAHA